MLGCSRYLLKDCRPAGKQVLDSFPGNHCIFVFETPTSGPDSMKSIPLAD